MLLDESNRKLIAHLSRALEVLVAPLGESIRAVWRDGSAPDARTVLENQLMLTAQQFINLREASEAEKQRYYEAVCKVFRLRAARDTFPLSDSTDLPPHVLKRLDRTPVSVSYLETHDARHGTRHADRARALFFQFANLVIKSDGHVTPKEEAALSEFKERLFPAGLPAREGAGGARADEPQVEPEEELKPPRPRRARPRGRPRGRARA